jgi:hypothetical protein
MGPSGVVGACGCAPRLIGTKVHASRSPLTHVQGRPSTALSRCPVTRVAFAVATSAVHSVIVESAVMVNARRRPSGDHITSPIVAPAGSGMAMGRAAPPATDCRASPV